VNEEYLVELGLLEQKKDLLNPLPVLFKAQLHGQKDRVFFSGT
jgi:hypothetical protein